MSEKLSTKPSIKKPISIKKPRSLKPYLKVSTIDNQLFETLRTRIYCMVGSEFDPNATLDAATIETTLPIMKDCIYGYYQPIAYNTHSVLCRRVKESGLDDSGLVDEQWLAEHPFGMILPESEYAGLNLLWCAVIRNRASGELALAQSGYGGETVKGFAYRTVTTPINHDPLVKCEKVEDSPLLRVPVIFEALFNKLRTRVFVCNNSNERLHPFRSGVCFYQVIGYKEDCVVARLLKSNGTRKEGEGDFRFKLDEADFFDHPHARLLDDEDEMVMDEFEVRVTRTGEYRFFLKDFPETFNGAFIENINY